jgi:hypothetical protein
MTLYGRTTVGKPDTPEREQAARVIASANSRYAAVRARTDLSDIGKQAQIAAIHVRTRAKLADLHQSERDQRTSERSDAETMLYGLPTRQLTGADAISRRDADDRADALTTPHAAASLLTRAQRTADRHLAGAVAQKAANNGWRDVLDQYIGNDTDKRDAYDTLVEHNQTVDTPQDKMTANMIFTVERHSR